MHLVYHAGAQHLCRALRRASCLWMTTTPLPHRAALSCCATLPCSPWPEATSLCPGLTVDFIFIPPVFLFLVLPVVMSASVWSSSFINHDLIASFLTWTATARHSPITRRASGSNVSRLLASPQHLGNTQVQVFLPCCRAPDLTGFLSTTFSSGKT